MLAHKEHLPVLALSVGDISRPGSEAAYKVGPLQCSGDSMYPPPLNISHSDQRFTTVVTLLTCPVIQSS